MGFTSSANLDAPPASLELGPIDLPTSDEQWDALVQAVADFVVVVDRSGKLLYYNRALAGYDVAADKSATIYDYAGPERRKQVADVLAHVFDRGEPYSSKVHAPGADGIITRYAVRVAPVLRNGSPIAAVILAADVTAQKQTEHLLRERERSLREAQRIARVGSWSWDITSDELHWSDEMHRIFDTGGTLPERWEPLIFERVHPDDRDLISAAFLSGLDGQQTFEPIEFRIVQRDGTLRYVVADASAEFDENEVVTRAFGTVQDISARKRMEITLQARMRRAAALAELGQRALTDLEPRALIDEAVVLVARTLDVDFSNVLELRPDEGELRVLTAAGREGEAKHLDVVVPLDSQAGYTLESNEPVTVEDLRTETRFSPDQRLLASGVVSHITVVVHGVDRPWGVLGAHSRSPRVFTDDEATFLQNVANVLGSALVRSQAEEALRESEERFRRLAGNIQDIIFRYRIEPETGIEYISPAAEQISGHPLEEFYSDPDLTHNMTHPDDRGTLAKAFFDGTTEPLTVRWIRPDGKTVWVEYQNAPVRGASGDLVAVEGVIRDITDVILMQETLQQVREDLESRVEARFPSGNDYSLTFREMTVLQLIVTGRADKEIGQHLGISTTTVHKHVASILDKMRASSRTEAGVRALREGLSV